MVMYDFPFRRRARSRLSSSSSSSSDPGEPRSAASGHGPVSLPHFTSAPPPASSEASVTARPPVTANQSSVLSVTNQSQANVLGLQKKEGLPPLPPSPPPRPGKTHTRSEGNGKTEINEFHHSSYQVCLFGSEQTEGQTFCAQFSSFSSTKSIAFQSER